MRLTGDGSKKKSKLTNEEWCQELVVLGLRLREGVSRENFSALSGGVQLEDALDMEKVRELSAEGFLVHDKEGLRTTRRGFLVLDLLLSKILRTP